MQQFAVLDHIFLASMYAQTRCSTYSSISDSSKRSSILVCVACCRYQQVPVDGAHRWQHRERDPHQGDGLLHPTGWIPSRQGRLADTAQLPDVQDVLLQVRLCVHRRRYVLSPPTSEVHQTVPVLLAVWRGGGSDLDVIALSGPLVDAQGANVVLLLSFFCGWGAWTLQLGNMLSFLIRNMPWTC